MKDTFNNLVSQFGALTKAPPSSQAAKKNKTSQTSNFGAIVSNLNAMPIHVVDGVCSVVTEVTDYLKVAEQENTKRVEINAKRDEALAKIRAQRETFSELMRFTFQERAAVIDKQFKALDYALAQGNVEIVQAALNSMVTVLKTSPFKSVQEMQAALGCKDFVVRLE